eukprot:scaffold24048_cov194-Amphora_coffeaeformis.AAC.6
MPRRKNRCNSPSSFWVSSSSSSCYGGVTMMTMIIAGVLAFVLLLLLLLLLIKPPYSGSSKWQNQPPPPPPRLAFRKIKTAGPNHNNKNNNNKNHTHQWTFRILQIADIHLGEAEDTAWGPEQDRKTWIALDRIVAAEQQQQQNQGGSGIDLIVLSGDQLTANNVDANATLYYQQLAGNLTVRYPHIPFAMIFGNHDDMPFETKKKNEINGTIVKHWPAKTTRRQLVQALQAVSPKNNSLTRAGPQSVFGVSNYWLDLWVNNDNDNNNDNNNNDTTKTTTMMTLGARILLLDTGGGMLPQQIHPTQLDWMVTSNQNPPSSISSSSSSSSSSTTAYNDNNKTIPLRLLPPVVAFAHIPTIDFAAVVAGGGPSSCRGERNEGIMNVSRDAGLVDTFIHAMGNVHVLAVGHMHGNDDCCPARTTKNATTTTTTTTTTTHHHHPTSSSNSSLLHLCFGRHSGYGGYGHWERGARVYELTLTDDLQFSWTSYVRMESGKIQDVYVPTTTTTTTENV